MRSWAFSIDWASRGPRSGPARLKLSIPPDLASFGFGRRLPMIAKSERHWHPLVLDPAIQRLPKRGTQAAPQLPLIRHARRCTALLPGRPDSVRSTCPGRARGDHPSKKKRRGPSPLRSLAPPPAPRSSRVSPLSSSRRDRKEPVPASLSQFGRPYGTRVCDRVQVAFPHSGFIVGASSSMWAEHKAWCPNAASSRTKSLRPHRDRR